MNKKAALGIYLVVLSTLFIFFCSAGTSPIYWHSYFGWDADVFMMGGKLVKEGMIPYKEVFDHKGPLMFFIQYIGQMICDKRLGIFILQIIFMFFSLLGVNRLAKLFFKEAGSIVMPFLSLIFLFQYYKEGNQTEEYCLPFLIWSYYFAAKYLMGDEKAIHKPVFSLFYGITFMVCALTRITNAFPLCAILLVGFVVMCKRKQWKMIWDNILAFFMGCILLLLPFVIYFWGNGGLYDMFYGTILYNIQYAEKTDLFATLVKVVSNPTWLLPQFMPLIVSFILGLCYLIFQKKNKSIALIAVIASALGCVSQLNSRLYPYYLQVWIPLFVIAAGLVPELLKSKKVCRCITVITIAGLSVVLCRIVVQNINLLNRYATGQGAVSFEKESKEIEYKIPKSDRDKVLAYNVKASFYIATDIHPCFKYCVLQDWQSSNSKVMQQELENFFQSGKAKYIVTSSKQENRLDYILKERYVPIEENDELKLYRLK